MTGPVPGVSALAARGFERFRVVRRSDESQSIVSFELVPIDRARSPSFVAGQFVALRLTLPDGEALLRHYSLSGDPAETSRWRISVKREPAPAERRDVPVGRGSTHLHDCVAVGDELELAGPAGAFTCAEDSERPVVLLSGGVGVTPLVSMLHRLARTSSRRVHFVHACESGAMHAFADEVRALAKLRDGITVHVCYRNPLAHDEALGACDSRGLLDKATLQRLLPLDDYEVYLCGPPGFMQANWRLLRNLGVAKERIHYEFFGPATVLEEPECDVHAAVPVSADPALVDAGGTMPSAPTVRFSPQADALSWNPTCHSLLDLAEQAGYTPPFSCRSGICNACVTPLLAGRVDYFEEPLVPPPEGEVLLCCTRPATPVTLGLPPLGA